MYSALFRGIVLEIAMPGVEQNSPKLALQLNINEQGNRQYFWKVAVKNCHSRTEITECYFWKILL